MDDMMEFPEVGKAVSQFFVRLGLFILFFILLGMATVAWAADPDMVVAWQDLEGTQNSLRLHNRQCDAPKVLARIKKEFHARWRAAKLIYRGQTYDSCWFAYQGAIYSIDEAGDPLTPPIPIQAFKPDPGV